MKLRLTKLMVLLSTLLMAGVTQAAEAPPSIQSIMPLLEPLSRNSILIEAVRAQNAKQLSLAKIEADDLLWREQQLTEFKQSLMENAAAGELNRFMATKPFFIELFLMDNQGANVAMTSVTSDYWQGDEDKWQRSFNAGNGKTFVGEMEFDESAQAYLIQVSLPIMERGIAIGAVTVGINMELL